MQKPSFRLIRENRKLIIQFILMFLFITIGAWFFKHEQAELHEVKSKLLDSNWMYVAAGIVVTVIYIFLQGLMYRQSFATVSEKVSITTSILLFLKRNFISVFIPAGGVTSLAFFAGDVEKKGVTKSKIHFASSIYAFVGILSVVLVAIPIFIYALIHGINGSGEIYGLAAMALLVAALYMAYRSLVTKTLLYRILVRFFPSLEVILGDLISHTIEIKTLIFTVVVSILVDLCGIVNVYIAMLALDFHPSVLFAMLGYLTTVVSLFISPFMRGLGVVEISLSVILTRFGYSSIEAVSITLLYRFFEFWVPLIVGALSFLVKINKLLMRIIPAVLIFALGIIDIISAITPAIHERVQRLQDFIPLDAMAASNYLVFVAGAIMLLSAVFMIKGLRNAWWIALFLSILSCIGHLTKAIDYEEATVALLVIIMLLYSRKEYFIKGNPRMHSIGIQTAVYSIFAVMVYGIVGFYFLDKRHFGIDFNILQSIRYTAQNFFLFVSTDLVPSSRFARDFLISINISGFLSLSFLFYTIIRPYISKEDIDPEGFEKANILLAKYGKSSLDYFKTYSDKLIFAPDGYDFFLAYRTAGNFAVVLENPVAASPEQMKQCITLFDRYCYENSLKSLFYRVPEESLPIYAELCKKSLFLGQEAVVDLETFTLSGVRNKALRNAVNKVIDLGYKSTILTPPIKDGVMQKLKAVSDDWLESMDRTEIIFSQGMFVWNELKEQTIIAVENSEEKVVAFLNIIPDFTPGGATYDLIRKTDDAPGGVVDFILIELFNYLKSQNFSKVNLGFAPLSGLDDSRTFPEKSMKFAYERIKSFSHYKGLRNFKEKFFPSWNNKYLIYSDDFDLLQIPAVLAKVIKPHND